MTQPVLFVSHGSPMLGLEPGAWGEALRAWALSLQGVKAVLVLSAHWEGSSPIGITSAQAPATLHDFSGFPDRLFTLAYPAPGDPGLAERTRSLLAAAGIAAQLDPARPLDHGAWVPLMAAFPEAEVPVIQVALPRPRTPRQVFELGQALRPLRDEGVLIVASGGIVHNLRLLDWDGATGPEPWALAFEAWSAERLAKGDVAGLLEGAATAPHYDRAVPTTEHFDPLFFALGAAGGSLPSSVYDGWQLGSLSLRCWCWPQGLPTPTI
jgi:4,5-DOPA dioxygenase extradiol